MEVRACYSVYSKFLPYTVCYLIIVRCGQGGSKRFLKDERLKLFDWVKMVSEETSDFISPILWLRDLNSSSRPQVSPKGVGNGERTRIEALLVARFDAEDLADERSTSVAQYKTARNKCQRNRDFLQ